MKLVALILAGVLASACATIGGTAPDRAVESISYETGPCFGACPIYKVTVHRNGTGLFEGRRYTGVTGEHAFRLTPAQFNAFARQLAPLRPAGGEQRYEGEMCGMMATDMPSADVRWREAGGAEQHLYFYYGCDMQRNRAIGERLRAAPELLPIAELIGAAR